MMNDNNRRSFLKTLAAAGVLSVDRLAHAAESDAVSQSSMAVAKYDYSPEEPDGIREEAEWLVRKAIKELGGMSRFVSKGDVVWVRPNICFPRVPEQAANNNPDVVAAVITLCYEAGAKEVLVSNHPSGRADQSFRQSGIPPVAEKAGGKVFLMKPEKFKKKAINGKMLKEWEVYSDVLEVDTLINLATVKHHPHAKVSMSIKGLMGLIGGQRNRFHADFTHCLPDLAQFFKPDLIVLDGIRMLKRNGPFGGNLADVERKDLVAAGTDQVAIDAFGAKLLGQNPAEIDYIREAERRFRGGLG